MNNQIEINEFYQQVAEKFNQRSNNYDFDGNVHPQMAHSLIKHANLAKGQKVLDMMTGTGLVAIEAAQLVGVEG